MKNRMVACCLAALLCSSVTAAVMPVQSGIVARAAEIVESGTCGENLRWELTSDCTLTISGSGKMDDYISTFNCPWHEYQQVFQSVVIQDGVTSIGEYAFSQGGSLISVTIADSVTSIGEGAFERTPWMEEQQQKDPFVVLNGILIDGKKCRGEITIPDSVTCIGKGAFKGSQSLPTYAITSVTIPDSVTRIEEWAFCYNAGLKSVTISDSVTSIGRSAFDGTAWLKEQQRKDPFVIVNGILIDATQCSGKVIIPDSVTSIGENAFNHCEYMTSVTIPDSVTRIGKKAFFFCKGLPSVTIPDGVTSIEDGAFEECQSLTSVVLPDSVTSIGTNAFSGCNKLTSVNIPDDVTSIGSGAFAYCYGLTSVTIPDSVTSIGHAAFHKCEGLTSVTILNADCEINDHGATICSGENFDDPLNTVYSLNGVIRGYEGSTAQAYAEKYGYTFEVIGDAPEQTYTVADVAALQKFLLGISKTGSADLNGDGITDIFDLGLMKRRVLDK